MRPFEQKFQTFNIIVEPEFSGQRLDVFLSTHGEIRSRSRAAQLIVKKLIQVNSHSAKASYRTESGDKIIIKIPLESDFEITPLDLKLDIIHEDADIIVVNKPAGLVVHPATSHQDDTLVNALVAHTDQLSMGFGEKRPGIVHRLDRDTSGLIVIAKNDQAHTHLAEQFKKRTMHRAYWAIIFGRFPSAEVTIESELGRHPVHRKKMASVPSGKRAVTHIKVSAERSGLSLLNVYLETGRTHQIRVHVSEKGHPIVGDEMYGAHGRERDLKSMKLRAEVKNLNRFALHAAELGFIHPSTNEQMYFAKGWPQDLISIVELCDFEEPFTDKVKGQI